MKKPTLVLLALGVSLPYSPDLAALTLNEAVHALWSRSRQLEAQQTQVDLTSGDRWRRFLFNEPQGQISRSDDGTAVSFGLSLVTAFPGKNIALIQADTARSDAQLAEYQARKYDLAKLAAQSYVDCASSQASLEVQKSVIADLEALSRKLRILYESGHSTQAETIGTELQLRQSNSDFAILQDRTKVTCRKLAELLHPGETVAEGPQLFDLPDDIDSQMLEEIGGSTSDQNRAIAAREVASSNSKTAFWNQLPDLTLTAQRNHYLYLPGSPSGAEWTTTFGVAMTVPILFPFRESVETKRVRSQAFLDQDAAELQLLSANSDQEDAAREYQRSKRRLHEIREKDLALAMALFESTFSAYKSGKLGFAELTLARKTLADLKSQDIQLRISIIGSHFRCLSHCPAVASQETPSS